MNENKIIGQLRVDNYINDWCQITEVGRTVRTSKIVHNRPISYRLNQVKFIPISEEAIKNFGFKKTAKVFYNKKVKNCDVFAIEYYVIDDEDYLDPDHKTGFYVTIDGRPLPKRLNYVHQLQNIWLDLTKESLKIKK